MEHHVFPGSEIPEAYGPYSHAVIAGDFVFVSGQIARHATTGKLIDAGIGPQTTRCLEIVREILAKCGLTLRDVVRVTVYLKDISDFDAMNREYVAAFPGPFPARSTPQVGLPFGALVGIEVTAYRSRSTA
jgi:2-iminobutanoate/2-iminopropanoate deaminase